MTIQDVTSCDSREYRRAGRGALALAVLAGVLGAAPALAQDTKDTGVETKKAEPQAPVPTAQDEGPGYLVSRFVLTYGRPELEGQPEIPDLTDEGFQRLSVRLGKTESGYVSPRKGVPEVTLRLRDITEGSGGKFYRSAIIEVCKAVVREFNRRGIYALFVAPSSGDIEERAFQQGPAKDLREGRTNLMLKVWLGVVAKEGVRTVAGGERVLAGDKINNPAHDRIRRGSPVRPGGLLRKDRLDTYTYALNRQPGRRVDVAVAAANQEGGVQIDYLVTENRPWTVFGQISNTGTKNTDEWRERFGFVHNQLTNHDDSLRIDYATAGFDASHDLSASYEFPLKTNVLRARLFAGYNQFTASDVGQSNAKFTGSSWTAGGELAWTFYQYRELFVDLVGGVRVDHVEVDNELALTHGAEDFVFPNLAVRLERTTDASRTFAQIGAEFTAGSADQAQIDNLGRPLADNKWTMIHWDTEQSVYLEPLFNPVGGTADGKGMTLAHEVAASFRGQYAMGNRVVPRYEGVAGGLYTVRGYPESAAAGDTTFVASLEYRFHLPQVFKIQPDPKKLWGKDFRVAPQGPYGRADWDLILKGFFDIGRAINSDVQAFEENQTLSGAGVGLEFQFRRNLSIRADLGFALNTINQDPAKGGEAVKSGDSRLHLVATLLY